MNAPNTRSHSTVAVEQAEQVNRPRDIDCWAWSSGPLFKFAEVPPGALNQLDGKQVTGPMRGFGPLWRKTYRISLADSTVAPRDLVRAWKANFPSFWPKGYVFYMPAGGIRPGNVALINMVWPGGFRLSTGMMVLFADQDEFSFVTPEGDVLAGWVTCSSHAKGETTVAQIELLVRSPDPLMDVALRLGGYRLQDAFWQKMLTSLGRYFGVEARPSVQRTCVDPRVQWSNISYVRYNPLVRAVGYLLSIPVRRFGKRKANRHAGG